MAIEDRHTEIRDVPGACSLDCPDACSWVVTVDGDVAIKLRGRPEHPFTKGGLCRKMQQYVAHTKRTDRLLHPLRRVGPKGTGTFERISWDDAMAMWAAEWQRILTTSGGGAIWPFGGTGNLGILQGTEAHRQVANVLGLVDHVADICAVAGSIGLLLSMGHGATVDLDDFADSGVIVLWGANPFVSNTHFVPALRRARAAGAVIFAIDPVRTATAEFADHHLAIRPGSDGALALALAAELIRRDMVDHDFVAERTVGFDEFATSVTDWSAARAAATCDIDIGQIETMLDLVAQRRGPLAVRLGMGMQRHLGGGHAARAISCLPAITGDHDRHGGGLHYSSSGAFGLDELAVHRNDLRTDRPRTLTQSRLGPALLEEEPPVEALLIHSANPVVSNPDQRAVREGLSRDDLFTIVIDHLPTPTTDYADLVLPATTQFEHHDLVMSYGHRVLQWNEAAVAPPGECRPITEMLRDLALRMGLTEPALFRDDLERAQAALGDDPSVAHIDFAQFRATGFAPIGRPRSFGPEDPFPLPSGRFHFVSSVAEQFGIGFIPTFAPPAEAMVDPSGDRLALLAPATNAQLNSIFGDQHQPPLLLHPDDAAARGIADGDRVCVSNERGAFEIVARCSTVARPGTAVTGKGYWPVDDGVNATTSAAAADIGLGAIFHDNAVTVRLVGA